MAKDQVQITFKVFNEDFTKAMSDMRENTTRLNREFRLQKEEMKLTGSETDKLKAQVGYLNERYDQAKDRVKATEEQLARAKKTFGENSEEVKKLEAQLMNAKIEEQRFANQLAEGNQKLKEAESRALKYSESLLKVGEGLQDAGKKVKEAGKSMTTKLTLPIVGAGVAAGKMSIDFNKAMANISTLIPGENERLLNLRDDIQEVAVVAGKSTDEIAAGTYDVISAYGDAADTMDKVLINAKAARSGLATTSDALNLSSAIMKGYGDTTAEANEKVMDLAFLTLKLGQTSFPDLASSMGKVVPTSKELGITQEELFAVFATGTGVTGNASEVSTQYQGALKALMAPTKDTTKLMKKLGVANGKAMIEQYGLIGSIEKIVEESKKSGKPLQSYIGSIQGQVLALALAGEQNDVYKVKLGELANASGALETAFAEQTEGINKTGFTFEQAMIKMQVAGQNFGDAMAPTIGKIADLVGEWTEKLRTLSPEQTENIIKIGLAVAAIGPLLQITGNAITVTGTFTKAIGTVSGAIGTMITGAEASTPAIGKLSSVFGALVSPAGLAVAAIGLAAGGVAYALWKGEEAARAAGKAGESFMQGVAGWHDGVDSAKSALEGFNMETIITSEKMAELENGIKQAQENIIGIAELAAEESREYTEKEREQIEELIGLIAEYTQQKIEAYEQQAKVVAAMATQERDITLERAEELIKGAEEARGQLLAISEVKYQEQISEAEKLYGHLGEKDKKRYEEMVSAAEKEYRLETNNANDIHGETLRIIQQKYLDSNTEAKKNIENVARINNELARLEEEKSKEFIDTTNMTYAEMQGAAKYNFDIENRYQKDRRALLKELEGAYKDAEGSNADAWLGMAMEAELYGAKIDTKTKQTAQGFIDSFQHLPKKSKETMGSAMQGMLSEMERKEPSLFKKATSIASGMLSKLKKAFDIRSPSREMAKIMRMVFEGADKPFDEAQVEMADKTRAIAERMMGEMEKVTLEPRFDIEPSLSRSVVTPINQVQMAGTNNMAIELSDLVVPVYLEGREIAKATAPYMDTELSYIVTNRRRGRR